MAVEICRGRGGVWLQYGMSRIDRDHLEAKSKPKDTEGNKEAASIGLESAEKMQNHVHQCRLRLSSDVGTTSYVEG